MRTILIGLLCASAWGQALITVTGPLKIATAGGYDGDMTVSWPAMLCGTTPVRKGSQTYKVVGGVVPTIQVYATASCGNNRYTVTYTGGTTAYWTIPATPSTQAISSIETLTAPALPAIPPFSIGQVSGLQAELDALALLIPGSAVPSVFGRTGTVVAQAGDYAAFYEPVISTGTTAQYIRANKTLATLDTLAVAENTNLYYTDARAVAAMVTSGSGAPGSTPGRLGLTYVDTVTQIVYSSTCLTSSACWTQAGGAITAGTGVEVTGTTTKTVGVDSTTTPQYSADIGAPTGVGEIGELYIRTDDNSLYLGTGSGWELVTAVASVTPSVTNGDVFITNDTGASAWGAISVGGGLTRAFAGSTITLALDTTAVPLLSSDNTYTGKKIVTPTAVQTLAAGDAITAAQLVEIDSAADVTLTGTPTVADGTAGEHMTILNTGAYAITLQDEAQLAGSNLFLAGRANFILLGGNAMQLIFSSTAGAWMQTGGGAITSSEIAWDSIAGNFDSFTGNFDDWTRT